jgi:hypothetical protein
MSAPLASEVGGALGPGFRGMLVPGFWGASVTSSLHARAVDQVANGDHEALARGVVAPGAGVVGAIKLVIRGVEEPLEHHWVWHAEEVPLSVPMRGGGWR